MAQMLRRIFFCLLILPALARGDSQVAAGKYRFTVITPNLIRIEYSPAGRFVDEPTYFAMDRGRRSDAKVESTGGIRIDTGVCARRSATAARPTSGSRANRPPETSAGRSRRSTA